MEGALPWDWSRVSQQLMGATVADSHYRPPDQEVLFKELEEASHSQPWSSWGTLTSLIAMKWTTQQGPSKLWNI